MTTALKCCQRCAKWLPIAMYANQKSSKDGKHCWCTPCNAEYARERRKRLTEADYVRLRNQKKRIYGTPKARATKRLYAQSERGKRVERYANIKKKYGLTKAQYHGILDAQQGNCAACRHALESDIIRTHIDHCHETNRIRGILCHNCNLALGASKEDEKRLANLIRYLRKTKAALELIGPVFLMKAKPEPRTRKEVCAAISRSLRGRSRSPEARELMRAAQKRRWARERYGNQIDLDLTLKMGESR